MEKKFFIAGVQHREGYQQVMSHLMEGADLDLVPEPANKFDPNAIRIMHEDKMLGYVPKKFNSEILAALSVGDVGCTITKLDASAKPWEMCEVEVFTDSDEMEESDEEDGPDRLDLDGDTE